MYFKRHFSMKLLLRWRDGGMRCGTGSRRVLLSDTAMRKYSSITGKVLCEIKLLSVLHPGAWHEATRA